MANSYEEVDYVHSNPILCPYSVLDTKASAEQSMPSQEIFVLLLLFWLGRTQQLCPQLSTLSSRGHWRSFINRYNSCLLYLTNQATYTLCAWFFGSSLEIGLFLIWVPKLSGRKFALLGLLNLVSSAVWVLHGESLNLPSVFKLALWVFESQERLAHAKTCY